MKNYKQFILEEVDRFYLDFTDLIVGNIYHRNDTNFPYDYIYLGESPGWTNQYFQQFICCRYEDVECEILDIHDLIKDLINTNISIEEWVRENPLMIKKFLESLQTPDFQKNKVAQLSGEVNINKMLDRLKSNKDTWNYIQEILNTSDLGLL